MEDKEQFEALVKADVAKIQERFDALVNAKAVAVLTPYRDAILALAEMVRNAAPDSQKKHQTTPKAKRAPAEPRVVEGAVEAAAGFAIGQKVRYRQGRGEFEATVEVNDKNTGELVLKRLSDGKIVRRPATKVTAA